MSFNRQHGMSTLPILPRTGPTRRQTALLDAFNTLKDDEELAAVFRVKAMINVSGAAHWTPEPTVWDEHPTYPVKDWADEATSGLTRLSYVDWVNELIELED